jgi:hydrophobe/amphiphile efflux-1 (HAE1) family protein
MKTPQIFIDRPIFASVLSLFILIVGGLAYLRLPVSELPEIAPPSIQISTTFPGASAQTVADTVAAVIEQEINGVDGMIYMYSQSTADGQVTIRVTFEFGTDIDRAQVLVQNRLTSAEPRLPEEVRRNGLNVRKVSPDFLMTVHLISPDRTYDQVYISNYALLNVQEELARIEGVGQVLLFGSREYSMRIWLDPARIAALGMTAEEVIAALRQQNIQAAGGQIGEPPAQAGAFQLPLLLRGRLREAAEFESIIVKAGADGRTVRVRDIARVELGALNYNSFGYQDRHPATVIVLTQTPGTDALKAARSIKAKMEALSVRFPKGLEYRIIYNATEFIEVSAKELNKTILEAVALVVLVMLLFLQTWRATIIPLVAIPISLIGTFAVMLALGYSLNTLTLFGLVLAVGIVVDDAIVVVENVERRLRDGLTPIEAARATMDEVGIALVAIAIVLVSVFIPAAFIGGITGTFFKQFAVTIAAATIISAFVSLTLSPALCAILFKPHDPGQVHGAGSGVVATLAAPVRLFLSGFNRGFDALAGGYSRMVGANARRNVVMLSVYAGLIGLALWMTRSTPTGFIPPIDRGFVFVSVQLPPGSSLERTNRVMSVVNEMVLATPGVKHTASFAGRNAATFTPSTSAGSFWTVLDDHTERASKGLTVDVIANDLRRRLAAVQEAQTFVFVPPPVRGIGSQAGFAMRLQDRGNYGSEELARIGQEFLREANTHPLIRNAFTTYQANTPQMFVDVDRDKAQMLRVPINAIFDALRIYMGAAYVNDFNMFGRTYRVTAQAGAEFRMDPEDVASIRVRSLDGAMVPLGSLISFRNQMGPERLPRYNLFPTVEISGQGAAGVSSGQVLDIMHELAGRVLPQGVTYEWTDLSFQERRAASTGYWVFALSIVFVFLALAALYESWALPLAIILIVPMCLFSGVFGVRLHGLDINVLTQIGFVVLIGLAAKNAILIVEFARQLEEQGKDRVTAAMEACRLRLRPIVMTSLCFILGVIPLYLAVGAGAEMRVALGTTMFWGMIGVTLFGLIFTPVFYIVIRGLVGRRSKRHAPAAADTGAKPQPAE